MKEKNLSNVRAHKNIDQVQSIVAKLREIL